MSKAEVEDAKEKRGIFVVMICSSRKKGGHWAKGGVKHGEERERARSGQERTEEETGKRLISYR